MDFIFARKIDLQIVRTLPNIKRRHKIIELDLFRLPADRKVEGLDLIGINPAECTVHFISFNVHSRWIVV